MAIRPPDERWQLPHTEDHRQELVTRLVALQPTLVVLEASGGLERPLVAALAAVSLPVVVVNPRQVRDFAKAIGRLAKTDALDAHVLAHFAEAVRPAPRPVPEADAQVLAALVGVAPFNRDSGTLRGKRTVWGAVSTSEPPSTWGRWWLRGITP